MSVEKEMHERQLEILRAIVDEYVATEEPVGSKALAQRHGFSVSPATIRNDMAVLEDAGLITQPHTSAGRIPTNSGYRLFVDRLAEIKPLSTPERRAIESFLDGAHDLDDVLSRTAHERLATRNDAGTAPDRDSPFRPGAICDRQRQSRRARLCPPPHPALYP